MYASVVRGSACPAKSCRSMISAPRCRAVVSAVTRSECTDTPVGDCLRIASVAMPGHHLHPGQAVVGADSAGLIAILKCQFTGRGTVRRGSPIRVLLVEKGMNPASFRLNCRVYCDADMEVMPVQVRQLGLDRRRHIVVLLDGRRTRRLLPGGLS